MDTEREIILKNWRRKREAHLKSEAERKELDEISAEMEAENAIEKHMTPENFCYWLKGWFELNQTIDHRKGATPETMEMIKNHLDLVFNKVDPRYRKKESDPMEGRVIEWRPELTVEGENNPSVQLNC